MELLITLVVVWGLSPPLLLYLYLRARRRAGRAEPGAGSARPDLDQQTRRPSNGSPSEDLSHYTLLSFELKRRRDRGEIGPTEYRTLADQVEARQYRAFAAYRERTGREEWDRLAAEAWRLFARVVGRRDQPAPWQLGEQTAAPTEKRPSPPTSTEPEGPFILDIACEGSIPSQAEVCSKPELVSKQAVIGESEVFPGPDTLPGREPSVAAGPLQAATPELPPTPEMGSLKERSTGPLPPTPETSTAPSPESHPQGLADFAWKPRRSGALERTLKAMSGWSRLLAPFLAQNIGWFVGGFSFVTGSIFLVAYTTGLANALAILGSLFVYTQALLWGGYLLRRKRPELAGSSGVLMAMGVFLLPLNVSAAVRLLEAGLGSGMQVFVSVLAGALVLGAGWFAGALASGAIERTLRAGHTRLFMLLASLQLAAPLLLLSPRWQLLAGLHGALLAILGYGLIRFTRVWVKSIFADRRKIAWYAAGTLVYAALVAFVYLTWSFPGALPEGYAGPFLMALSGLLFYVDAQTKAWVKRYTFLSRFTFAIYGLSLLALLVCFDAPVPRAITLLLGVGVYGTVMWKYLTAPPMYLLLGSAAWLYATLVLEPFPQALHFLLGVPGLLALWALGRFLERRGAAALANACGQLFVVSVTALVSWSLTPSSPGPIAVATGLAATVMVFRYWRRACAAALSGAPRGETHRKRRSSLSVPGTFWLYTAITLAVVTLAYAPYASTIGWSTQFAFTLVPLAFVLATAGLRSWEADNTGVAAAYFNGALLILAGALGLALAVAAPDPAQHRLLPFLPVAIAGVLLRLALALRVRWLLYGALLCGSAAGALLKLAYFPAPAYGSSALLAAVAIWLLIWWLRQEPEEVAALRRESERQALSLRAPLTLLWRYRTTTQPRLARVSGPTDQGGEDRGIPSKESSDAQV